MTFFFQKVDDIINITQLPPLFLVQTDNIIDTVPVKLNTILPFKLSNYSPLLAFSVFLWSLLSGRDIGGQLIGSRPLVSEYVCGYNSDI